MIPIYGVSDLFNGLSTVQYVIPLQCNYSLKIWTTGVITFYRWELDKSFWHHRVFLVKTRRSVYIIQIKVTQLSELAQIGHNVGTYVSRCSLITQTLWGLCNGFTSSPSKVIGKKLLVTSSDLNWPYGSLFKTDYCFSKNSLWWQIPERKRLLCRPCPPNSGQLNISPLTRNAKLNYLNLLVTDLRSSIQEDCENMLYVGTILVW